ncbi:MAG: hypothetical protein LBT74_10320 [Acidobacteriota bacterium]|jgi:hypothetical protein|nr:hypothetical protein [Acidobacteriota bacterium]
MAREIYAVIDEELRERPLWQPPPGFAARATRLARVAPGAAPRGQSGANGPPAAVFSGLLVAVLGILVFWRFDAFATGYAECCAAFSGALADNAQQVAWAAAVLSLCLSAWVARRSLRPQD